MTKLRNAVLAGLVAICWTGCAKPAAPAGNPVTAPVGKPVTAPVPVPTPVVKASVPANDVLPTFGDPIIDPAMAAMAKQREVAVVQYGQLRELAAKSAKANAGPVTPERREGLNWAIADILYPDQFDAFESAYEKALGEPADAAHKMARNRLRLFMGYEIPLLDAPKQAEIIAVLMKYYEPVCKELAALDAAGPARGADYKAKRLAIIKPTWARSMEIANGLFTDEQRKAVAGEWLRRQNRRVDVFLRPIANNYTPKTAEKKKEYDGWKEALYTASRSLDLEDPQFTALCEKFENDVEKTRGN